jgi:hypothetical protein
MPITPEREDAFVDALLKTGSLSAAAAAASPHLVRRGSTRYGIATFRDHARRNPAFAARVEAALTEVRGKMESLVLERALTPDEKPVFNPKTGEMFVAVDRRNANVMLSLWLASHHPDKWAPKKNVQVDAKVQHTANSLTSGAQWVIKTDDILLLSDPAEQQQLIALLSKMEDARREREAQLPAPGQHPNRPYQGWGVDEPPALPAPEDANG